jgi:hypothetical protein
MEHISTNGKLLFILETNRSCVSSSRPTINVNLAGDEITGSTGVIHNNNINFDDNKSSNNTSLNIEYLDDTRTIPKKLPMLLNNIQNMFDMTSQRARRRNEQIKKMKGIKTDDNDNENEETGKTESAHGVEYTKEHDNSFSKCLRNLVVTKRYQNDDNNMSSDYEKENTSYSKTSQEEVTEVVVSDLEIDLEDTGEGVSNNNILNFNMGGKSFVPINNCLRSRTVEPAKEKATASYLMALGQYQTEEQEDIKRKHNYDVDDVIIEETSENNTDSEVFSPKKLSKRISLKLNSNLNSLNEFELNNIANPKLASDKKYSLSETFPHSDFKQSAMVRKYSHKKNSKSEMFNFNIDLNKLLYKRKINETKSNHKREFRSHHNFPYKITVEDTGIVRNTFEGNNNRYNKLSCNFTTDYEKFVELFNNIKQSDELPDDFDFNNILNKSLIEENKDEVINVNDNEININEENFEGGGSMVIRSKDNSFDKGYQEDDEDGDENNLEKNINISINEEERFDSDLDINNDCNEEEEDFEAEEQHIDISDNENVQNLSIVEVIDGDVNLEKELEMKLEEGGILNEENEDLSNNICKTENLNTPNIENFSGSVIQKYSGDFRSSTDKKTPHKKSIYSDTPSPRSKLRLYSIDFSHYKQSSKDIK